MSERIDVFISSTSRDLTAYREAVRDVVLRLGMHPVIMEAFNPTDRNALKKCYDEVQRAEVFVGIYAHRYGYAPGPEVSYTTVDNRTCTGDGKTSITHLEYLWAAERGLPMLLFVVDETAPWPLPDMEDEPGKSALKAFKADIMGKHVVGFFHSPDNLATQVATGLAETPSTYPEILTPTKPTTTPPPIDTRDPERILLAKVREFWIDGYLKQTKLNDVWLELPADERPEAVEPLISRTLATAPDEAFTLTDKTGIGPLFRATERSLLILGAPGSGKTITLLELAQDLLDEADADLTRPIPVVLNLASWAEKAPERLEDWLAERLRRDYGVSSKAAERWVEDGELLFLLDGLDEVAADRRDACVDAINAYWQRAQTWGDNGLAVCSRINEYEALSTRLKVQKAIQLQPLTLEQVQAYVAKLGPAWAGLQQALAEDTNLQALAQSPLDLNIMAVAYRGKTAAELTGFADSEAQERHLYDNYITQRLRKDDAHAIYSHADTRHYLAWLARGMVARKQSIFHIENLTGAWLDAVQQKQARRTLTIVSWLIGLVGGLIGGLVGALDGGVGGVLVFGLFGVLVGVLVGGRQLDPTEVLIDQLKWSWKRLVYDWVGGLGGILAVGLIVGLVFGLIGGLVGALDGGLGGGLGVGLIGGLGGGLVGVLVFGLVGGLRTESIELKSRPNQSIWRSLRNGLFSVLVGVLVGGLVGVLVFGLFFLLIFGLIGGLVGGLFVGLGIGWNYGLRAILIHAAIRRSLYRSGDAPKNYADFLTYTSSRHLTRQIGGGFIFRHRKLMEHFARSEW